MDEIILIDDDRAAHYGTDISGWVSRDGIFYGDGPSGEQVARYSGCTHIPCSQCGTATPKGYTRCDACRERAEIERYEAMPEEDWDGRAMLYSQLTDRFYDGIDEAEYDADEMEGQPSLSDMRLVICRPVYAHPLETDYFAVDMMDEAASLPAQIEEAMDAFNAAIAGVILSWEPGRTRLRDADAPLIDRAQSVEAA